MQIVIDLLDQGVIVIARGLGNGFDVEREALVLIRGQECHQFATKSLACRRVGQELCGELRPPFVGDGVEVVDQRENFRLRLLTLEERHHFVVDRPRLALVVHHVVKRVELGDGLQPAVRSEHVHPLGKEQVDLRVILLQRGEAGGVPLHIERASNAFVGVQYDLRGGALGLAMSILGARWLALLVVLERVIGLLDAGKRDAGHRRSAHDRDDEKNHQ